MRSKRALINTIYGLLYEAVALACGMILPRLILGAFGSDYNGITNSISQFLSAVSLLRAGIGGVTKAALYKPLAEGDTVQVSRVVKATEKFLHKVALIFLVALVAFACVYPAFVNKEFKWFFSFSLVIIIGLSTFAQYQFGLTYHLLLLAAQRNGVVSLIQIFTTILNTIVASILIYAGAGIHVVKLGSALIFALNPIAINLYAKHKFRIVKNVEPDNDAISQRWDAFAHQVAFFVNTNTDIMVLTWFATLKDVSIYSVYYLVINGITIVVKNSIQSVAAAFGDMIAKKEGRLLQENFDAFETMTASVSTILFGTTLIMIVPFISLYTKGVTDASYIQPFFAVLITIAGFFNCIRIPYQNLVEAAGHFKQTKVGAYFEAGMNVLISVVCVFKFGLIGVAIGTLFATLFRTIQFSIYMCQHIVKRSWFKVVKSIGSSGIIILLTVFIHNVLPSVKYSNYLDWILISIRTVIILAVLVSINDIVFFRGATMTVLNKARGILSKRTNA
ncbi:lipopolysaccharide biosynthesis protein [uncultured Ruminococcus sp.]|uniref:lipopolysaccharide biosynthesis protein n=1 Tax=uncultured Ruminococcus sp. TaxID=165186 RepID=UPI002634B6FF|nr:polysaccharide biosynthesis C-terminal domain-containing protein [uncultured Ruminococcus sp.]